MNTSLRTAAAFSFQCRNGGRQLLECETARTADVILLLIKIT